MAVSYVSGSGYSNTIISNNTRTVSYTNAQAGDYIVVSFMMEATTTWTTVPSTGWTLLASVAAGGGILRTWGKYWSTAPPASENWTVPSSSNGIVMAAAFRGVHSTTPIFGTPSATAGINGTNHTTTSVASVPVGAYVIGIFGIDHTASVGWTAGLNFASLAQGSNGSPAFVYGILEGRAISTSGTYDASATSTITINPAETIIVLQQQPNTAPSFSVQPSVTDYTNNHIVGTGSLTRLGTTNNATVTFTVTDSEETGSNALEVSIRTSNVAGGGTLVLGPQDATAGVSKTMDLLDNLATLNTSGTKTLYVHVTDGTATTVSNAFTVNVDVTAPAAPSSISHSPNPVVSGGQYSVTFSSADTHSTTASEMRWSVRTGAGGTGTIIGSGSFTQGASRSTGTITDNSLVNGSNTRYLMVEDGGGNLSESSFTVTASFNTPPTITVTPSVEYGPRNRTGPNNTPATMTFTATDTQQTGADALTYTVRTAASGGGTLVVTGSNTSGVSEQVSIAYNASGLVQGSNTLYLRVSDGTDFSADQSFVLLVDTGAPTVGTITVYPAIVTE